jgi:hypothetical protein
MKSYPCGEAPLIKIEADDHLSLTGWDQNEIQIKIRDESGLYVRQSDDTFSIQCETDCVINVPKNANIEIETVNGSASISALSGNLTVGNVGGHLTLREVAQVEVDNVGGHLKAYQVNGDLQVMNIGGSIKGGNINGLLKIDNVGGSVKLTDVQALQTLRVGGNIKLKLLTLPGDLKISAGANIKLWLPKETSYELSALSGAERIVLRSVEGTTKYSSGRQKQTIGAGGPLVKLNAGAAIMILENGLEEELDAEVDGVEKELDGILGAVFRDRTQERIQEGIRRAEARTKSASQRAESRLRRAMERMGRDFDFPKNAWGGFGPEGQSGSKPTPKASNEERMLILNMLREKKISAEEANRLLDALEGKFE